MPLPINTQNNHYNNTFSAFVQFAEKNVESGKSKAIANVAQLKVGQRTIVASKTDSVGSIFFRSRFEMNVNDAARKIFLSAVARMFGGMSKIPPNVLDALNLQDYGHGQPLTARRIMAVKNAIDAHLSAPPNKIELDVCGKKITLEKWHYERMVEAMPQNERPRGLAGRAELANMLKTMLSQRISNGLEILKDIRSGNGGQHKASAKNVANLTLALHVIALSNGDKLKEGAITVADPDGSIARWLDTSDELYLRESSHLKAYQGMTVDGHRNIRRGLDIPEGKDGLFAGMRTVHYGTIPDLNDPNGNGCGPNRRLFLKCETRGVYHNPISKSDQQAGMTPGMRQRAPRSGDWSESILHAFSFLGTRTANPTAGGARKEHMTAGIKAALDRAVRELAGLGRQDLADRLTARNVKKGGAMLLLDNIEKAVHEAENDPELKRVFDELGAAINADVGNKHGAAASRLGNEVMIDESDIAEFTAD